MSGVTCELALVTFAGRDLGMERGDEFRDR